MPRLTQAQRKRLRDKADKADSIACAERANQRCELCGVYCESPYGENHHDIRRHITAHRHNPANHSWLCCKDHRWAHDNYAEGRFEMDIIRTQRGDTLATREES